jgi:hypothetical protein
MTRPGLIYGAARSAPGSNWRLDKAFFPRGYFQLWHASDPHYSNRPMFDESFAHAGGYDSQFWFRWPIGQWAELPIRLTHFGTKSRNWFGAENPDSPALTEAVIGKLLFSQRIDVSHTERPSTEQPSRSREPSEPQGPQAHDPDL